MGRGGGPRQEGGAIDSTAALAQALHVTITDLAPLQHHLKKCRVVVEIGYAAPDSYEPAAGLDPTEETVSALGDVFSEVLRSLEVDDCDVDPSFWAALPHHLPQLSNVMLDGWNPHHTDPAFAALVQLANSYRGPSLHITLVVDRRCAWAAGCTAATRINCCTITAMV